MILYNITSKMTWSIHEPWLEWMKTEHIPEVLATGYFKKSQILRLLDTDEEDGPTYAVQYFADTHKDYEEYVQSRASDLRQKAIDKWGNQLISFRTVMEVIN